MYTKIFFAFVMSFLAITTTTQAEESTQPWDSEDNCLLAESDADNPNCWKLDELKKYGKASFDADSGLTTLASIGDEPAYTVQDFEITDATGRYILLIGFTQAEEVREGDSITGLPYLYGYQMTSANFISEYMQGQEMLFDGVEGEWDLSYGVYPIEPSVQRIRLFLKQASQAGDEFNGSEALFKQMGVFLVDTEAEAEEIINAYTVDISPEAITGVEVTNITDVSAKITWQEQTDITRYHVKIEGYLKGGRTSRIFPVHNKTARTLKRFVAEKNYTVYVRAVNSSEIKGPWSEGVEFTTLAAD